MKPNHHPNSALLMAYASGNLTEAFSLVVASHLSFCQECRQKVNDAEMIGGALIDDLEPCNVNMSSLDQILSKLDDIAEPIDNSDGADKKVDLTHRQHRVADALAMLPPEQCKVVQMSFFEDKSHGEISEELNIPLGTVKSRMRLAFERIRNHVGDTV